MSERQSRSTMSTRSLKVGHLTRKKILDLFNEELEDDNIEACMSEYKNRSTKAKRNYSQSLFNKTMTSPKSQQRGENAQELKKQSRLIVLR